ncbi:hypothetical protein ACIBQ1_49825 [Nonomuraea sp. NPDC050153]|uniref:hypothetical protein n=1 Tax=Nonomuraea sp. NPDC050153 TaxID=3364359 RepID=UPI0037920689
MSSRDPYTYVSMAMYGTERPQLHISFHTPYLRANTMLVEKVRPVLCLETSEAGLTISTTGAGLVTDQDVMLARKIADAATAYLADCERLHAEQSAPDQATSDQTAA